MKASQKSMFSSRSHYSSKSLSRTGRTQSTNVHPSQDAKPSYIRSKALDLKSSNQSSQQTLRSVNPSKGYKQPQPIPIELRMAIRFNKIESLKAKVIPSRAKELTNFPLWNKYPLDSKIPDYRSQASPQGSIYFTRGKLGKSLYAKVHGEQEFDLSDPKRQRVPLQEYTALHDPLAANYFQSTRVRHHLQKLSLVNEQNEVVCNAKDFNQFRAYLQSIQSEMVFNEIKLLDDITDKNNVNEKSTKKDIVSQRNLEKLTETRKMQQQLVWDKAKRAERSIKKWKQQIDVFERNREEQNKIKKVENADSDEFRLHKIKLNRLEYKRQIIAKLLKDDLKSESLKACRTRNKRLAFKKEEKDEMEKFTRIQDREEQKLKERKRVVSKQKEEREQWIKNYESRFHHAHVNHEKVEAAKKKTDERELFLMRKYYDLWRAFVLRHREGEKKNTVPQSNWPIYHYLKKTVHDLERLSGYDPKHNFFADMLQNRRNIGSWVEKQKKMSRYPEQSLTSIDEIETEDDPALEKMLRKSITRRSTLKPSEIEGLGLGK